jgi:hypothetical protein
VQLVVRLAEENPRWGYVRIAGECAKVGLRVSATSVRAILRRHGLGPAPRRGGPSWAEFLRAQAAGTLACDFLTVETVGLTLRVPTMPSVLVAAVLVTMEESWPSRHAGGIGSPPATKR